MVSVGAKYALGLAVIAATWNVWKDKASASQTESSYWLLTANYSQLVFSTSQRVFLALSHDHRTIDYLDPLSRTVVDTLVLPGTAIPFRAVAVSSSDPRRASVVLTEKRLCLIDVAERRTTVIDFPQLTDDPFICGTIPGLGRAVGSDGACVWLPPLAPYDETVAACGSAAAGRCTLCGGYPALKNSWGFAAQHPNGRWIYETEPPAFGKTTSFVKHYNNAPSTSANLCPTFVRQREVSWGKFYAPRNAWFSGDGSIMFFSNGMTMTTGEDEGDDLAFGPTFNNTANPMSLVSVRHLADRPAEIAALMDTYSDKDGVGLVVQMFRWPTLMPLQRTFSIPLPQGEDEPHHLYLNDFHFSLNESPDDADTLYVVVTYAYDFSPRWIPAVVYIKI